MAMPNGYTSDFTVSVCEVSTEYTSLYPTYDSEPWFPYVTSDTVAVEYNVVAGSAGKRKIKYKQQQQQLSKRENKHTKNRNLLLRNNSLEIKGSQFFTFHLGN